MDFVEYKCPCCGAALKFSSGAQKLKCDSCGNKYDVEALKEWKEVDGNAPEPELHWEFQKEAQGAKRTADGKYICPSCAGEIEVDEDTVSTKCPYCDNVVVIRATASGEFEPDAMIPFQVEAGDARQRLENFCRGKRLLPRDFKNKSYLKNLKGYYVPYWLFDCDARADMSFRATRVHTWSDSEYDYVDTSHYLVHRGGEMEFYHVPVDGSTEMDDRTTESIEPFDYAGLTDFNPAYLAGYETDKYDVDEKTAEVRAKERLYNTAETALRNTVTGYGSVVAQRRQMGTKGGRVSYALLPVWLFETIYDKKKYQFAINGQTGRMVGELPVDKGAYWKYLCGFTALGTAVCSLIGIWLFGGVL